jgi:Domain of unknown function (DUF4082)
MGVFPMRLENVLRSFALPVVLALATDARAEVACHAENAGPEYEDFSSTGNATFGIQFTASDWLKVRGARIFTGEKTGSMMLAIYDDAGDTPGISLTNMSFACQLAVGFQGGDFALPIVLSPGTKYWLAWQTIAGAQSPIDPPGAELGQPFRVSLDGGQTWGDLLQSQERHFKFQLMCDCPALADQYGSGCDGSGGFVPNLRADDCAIAGGNLTITLDQALGGANAILFLGIGQSSLPINGTDCSLVVLPILPVTVTLPLAGSGAGAGTLTLFGALPPGTTGVLFTMQALIPDPGVARGFAATNGLAVVVY